MRARLALVAAVLGLLTGAACTSSPSEPEPPPPPAEEQVRLRVMAFNIEYGGTVVSFASVVEAVRASGADVVVVNEPEGNTARLARALGWEHWSRRMAVVSQLPLLDPPDGGDYVYVATSPGQVVALTSVHLPSSPYGPNQIRDGLGRLAATELEREVRVPALEPIIETMGALAADGVPVFVAGDFNAPAHTDWTPDTVGARSHLRFPMSWPTSRAMTAAGFTDSYRATHPDPVADPGLTWPARAPRLEGYPPPPAVADRIDFVWAGGPATVTESAVVGEPGPADIEVDPWPSDHRGVVSTFEVEPAEPPALLAVAQPLTTVGDDVTVTVHRPGDGAETLVVTRGADTLQPELPDGPDATVRLETARLEPGRVRLMLTDGDGSILARTASWLRMPGRRPQVRAVRPVYDVGEPIRVAWSWAPANRFDWIAVAPRDEGADAYLNYTYTRGTVAGRGAIDADAEGEGVWPLPPGRYSLYLSVDDGYERLAQATFRVRRG